MVMIQLSDLCLLTVFSPAVSALVVGLFGTGFFTTHMGRASSHYITTLGVLISAISASITLYYAISGYTYDADLYVWYLNDLVKFSIGFLIDPLSATMMVVVTYVSLCVHIYAIGYMASDPGYQRFFAYISLFTFFMLMLVTSNNMLQLFFGWEAVGLASYLLIGFWYTRPAASSANIKAFIMNRVGDMGFIVGLGLIFSYTDTTHYDAIFCQSDKLGSIRLPGTSFMLPTVICICLFTGAMGKSAQIPLHSWLPDSMEGPTPVSALIHAATMVTAGIFMVVRFSPIFELSEYVLSFIMTLGALSVVFMGILGTIQNDIKRIIAYSTLSQLGYMTAALGASAYSAAIFHLVTHAFFKALLFLSAGSVIMSMHHDQDIRNMGGLRKFMPITHITFLIGTLSLVGLPLFSGFYSKEHIIEAVGLSSVFGSTFSYLMVLSGVFITSFYSFRMYFLVFYGERKSNSSAHTLHESPKTITGPLIFLAFFSIALGGLAVEPMLFGDLFDSSARTLPHHITVQKMDEVWNGCLLFAVHSLKTTPFQLTIAGAVAAWYCSTHYRYSRKLSKTCFSRLYNLLDNKYYFDHFNEKVVSRGVCYLGYSLLQRVDRKFIDGCVINGITGLVTRASSRSRILHSGLIFHYAITMIIAVVILFPFAVFLP